MRWPGIQELYGPSLKQTRVFGSKGTQSIDAGDIHEDDSDNRADKRWSDLRTRVIEHVCDPSILNTRWLVLTLQ